MPDDIQQQNAICRLLAPVTARGYTWLKKLKPDSFPRIVINWAGQIDRPAAAWYFTTPCAWPWRTFAVCSDGQVAPCCYDMDCTMRLGKVPEQTLEEVWNSEPVHRLREQLRSGRLDGLELCHHCDEARTHLRRFLP